MKPRRANRVAGVRAAIGLAVASACWLAAWGGEIPKEARHEYTIPGYAPLVYLVQAPEKPAADAPLVIYMHGANHDENQGMTLYPILRQLLADKGWILVSPRHYDYAALRADLKARYGERRIFLAGASAGARASFEEVRQHPKEYAGLFLIGPALAMRKPAPGEVTIPTFMIYGDQDGRLSASDVLVANALKEQKTPLKEIVIKGGGHEAPYPHQEWWYEALPFVTGEVFPKP